MQLAAAGLITLVMLIHLYIVLIETVLFRSHGVKAFNIPPDRVEEMAPFFSNQGCYNLFLVIALALALFYPETEASEAFTVYGLGCVMIAGIWGALTFSVKTFFIQTLPAAIALPVFYLA